MHKQVFPAKLDSLHSMLFFIQSFLLGLEAPAPLLNKITLAAEEALTNIIDHGYPNTNGSIEISCEKCLDKPGIKIVIQDHGIPFNPLEQAHETSLPDPTQILAKSSKTENIPGGFGIHIFMRIMDHVDYQRLTDCNRLSLIKYF